MNRLNQEKKDNTLENIIGNIKSREGSEMYLKETRKCVHVVK